jgi:hypothetical protein
LKFHHKLQVAYGKPNVVITMELRRLELAGHVERMSEERTVKKVVLEKPDRKEKQKDQNYVGQIIMRIF